ncbi:MAG: nitroreductase family protein [Candidatus Brocadiia bacterium]
MDTMEAIYGRHSIRSFTDERVSDEEIDILLKAAMAAPSAGNQQPWHFVVIDDREVLDAIPKFHAYSAMLKQAPAAIAVCGDLSEERHEGFWVQDCSAAVENLLIAAHDRGLGAVWLGIHPAKERVEGMSELLETPENVVPFAVVALGYPAEEKAPCTYYDESRVHRNRW